MTTLQAVTWAGAARQIPRRRNSAEGRGTPSERTGPGVQRPEAPTTSKEALGGPQGLITLSTVQLAAWPQLRGTPPSTANQVRYEVPPSKLV